MTVSARPLAARPSFSRSAHQVGKRAGQWYYLEGSECCGTQLSRAGLVLLCRNQTGCTVQLPHTQRCSAMLRRQPRSSAPPHSHGPPAARAPMPARAQLSWGSASAAKAPASARAPAASIRPRLTCWASSGWMASLRNRPRAACSTCRTQGSGGPPQKPVCWQRAALEDIGCRKTQVYWAFHNQDDSSHPCKFSSRGMCSWPTCQARRHEQEAGNADAGQAQGQADRRGHDVSLRAA